jgi:hypothetical protein
MIGVVITVVRHVRNARVEWPHVTSAYNMHSRTGTLNSVKSIVRSACMHASWYSCAKKCTQGISALVLIYIHKTLYHTFP